MLIIVTGRVQGVAFRACTRDEAIRLELKGYVRNLADGGVEIVAEGQKPELQLLIDWAAHGPSPARVQSRHIDWLAATGEFAGFDIRY